MEKQFDCGDQRISGTTQPSAERLYIETFSRPAVYLGMSLLLSNSCAVHFSAFPSTIAKIIHAKIEKRTTMGLPPEHGCAFSNLPQW